VTVIPEMIKSCKKTSGFDLDFKCESALLLTRSMAALHGCESSS